MKWKGLINTAYPPKPNGNMPAEPAHKQAIFLVTMSQNSKNMHGMLEIQVLKLIQFARRNQTPGVFMICTGMSGNGCRTNGMKITMDLLPVETHGKKEISLIGYLVEEAGIVIPNFAGRLAASGANPIVVLAILGFAC